MNVICCVFFFLLLLLLLLLLCFGNATENWYSCARDIYPIPFECEMCYRKLRLFLFIFVVRVLALSCDSMSMCHRLWLWPIMKSLMGKKENKKKKKLEKERPQREITMERKKCSHCFWWTWFESWSLHLISMHTRYNSFYSIEKAAHMTLISTHKRKHVYSFFLH